MGEHRDTRPLAQPETEDPDGAPTGAGDEPQAAMSIVAELRRLRVDDDTLEDAVRLAKVRAQLLDRHDSPVRVGRFRLLAPVGRGGMGTVYEAYDPELDRKVAIKLLRPGDAAVERSVLDEGRALAKLVHPNVVTVHEVGTHEGEAFVVMELVRGPNLRAWMHGPGDAPRPWAEVVRVFAAAAAGLAAAHAAGIRHGDVKPDNIVLGEDGRTRVVDFGIARGVDGSDDDARAGTPSYMAPEQLAGGPVDARADQYGFCVALFEVLHLARPAGTPPSFAPAIPWWLQVIIARGLSTDPALRFASFDELGAALERGRAGRGRKLAWLAGVAGALVVGGLALRSDPVDPCAGVRAPLEHGGAGEPRLDAHVAGLDALAARLCAWEHAPPADRPPLLAERRACLDAAVAVTDVAIESIRGPAGPRAAALPYVLDELETTAACDDPAMLKLRPPMPSDPATQARVAAIDWDLLVAAGEAEAGFAEDARARLAALSVDAEDGVSAFRGGRVRLGQVQIAWRDAGQVATAEVREVLWAALAADQMLDAIEAATMLVTAVAEREGSGPAEQWFELASALLHRVGDPAPLWAVLWCSRARGLAAADRHAEADAALESAAQYTDPDDAAAMIRLLRERASARGLARRWTEARADYERALALHRSLHGEGHPGELELELELALALSGEALSDEALRRLDDVVDRLTQRVGPLHGRTLRARRARCIVAAGRDGPAEEEACLLGLAEAYREAGRPRQAASVRLDRALALASLGRHDEAAALLREALADPASPWPPLRTTASLARVEFDAGRVDVALQLVGDRLRNDDERSEVADRARQTEFDLLLAAGRVDAAEDALQRAIRLAVGDPIGFVGRRGMLAAARGDLRTAVVDLETGMLMATVEVDVLGPFARRLAEVRAQLDPTDPRARELGEVALELYEYGPGTARQADEVRRWLASLPAPRLVRD